MRQILRISFLILIGHTLFAQEVELDLEHFAEQLFQIQSEDVAYEDLYESLLMYYTNPLNLNSASTEELYTLYMLSPSQLRNLTTYLEQNGKLLSVYELQAIPGFDLNTIKNLLPFITVDERKVANQPLVQRVIHEENNYLLLRYNRSLQRKRGFNLSESNRYRGDQNHYYGRFRVSHSKDFSFGFTFEKDAGESFRLNNKTKGFDFYSFHAQVENKGIIKSLVIGDYQIQTGQGLIYGAGFNAGKGAETIASVKRSSTGIKPYTSVLESGFFRGAAVTIGNQLSYTLLYSNLRQDANIALDTSYSDHEVYITGIQATGMHRTSSEYFNKNQVSEQNLGSILAYRKRNFQMEGTLLYSNFNSPIQKRPNNYNQFEFSGSSNYLYGLNANYLWQNFIFFSEVAQSKSGGIGAIAGFAASLSKIIDASVVIRNYDRNFHSFYGNGFGENSRNINEKGIYWGIKIKPGKQYFFTAYFDNFSFPWLKYRTEAPSQGHEFLVRANYRPYRNILIYAQIRQEVKQRTIADQSNLNVLIDIKKSNYLVNLDFKVNQFIAMRSRVQWSSFHGPEEITHGMTIVQDVNVKYKKFKLSTRVALFETDDFENRQYIYERNVRYSFSIPSYNGSGIRTYLVGQFKPTKSFTIQAKYGQYVFPNETSTGSGNEMISGKKSSSVTIQVINSF